MQILMTLVAKDQTSVLESNSEGYQGLNELVGIRKGFGWRQFVKGTDPQDQLKAEESLHKATDLVLSVMVNVGDPEPDSFFFQSITRHAWFSSASSLQSH